MVAWKFVINATRAYKKELVEKNESCRKLILMHVLKIVVFCIVLFVKEIKC